MKGKIKRKLQGLFMAVAMAVLAVVPVSADGTVSKYTAINGGTTTFYKYLVVKEGATNPQVEFSFNVSVPNDTEIKQAGTGELQVKPGPMDITVEKATFATGEADNTDTGNEVKNSPFASYTFEKKTVTVDLTKVSFNEPGVYRYYIEENTTNTVFGYDSVLTRTLDVYIMDDGTGKLAVQGYTMYEGKIDSNPKSSAVDGAATGTNGAEAGTKSDRFTNTYPTYTLKVTKTVAGNQGSKDKYFKFNIRVQDDNIVNDAYYPISGQDVLGTDINTATTYTLDTVKTANAKTYVTGLQLKEGFDVYLQHGDEVSIMGLPLNSTYTITEDNEEYTKTAVITKDSAPTSPETISDGIVAGKVFDGNTTVAFTNTKTGVIPTGILLSVVPWVIAGIIILIGIIFFAVRSKKRYEEE